MRLGEANLGSMLSHRVGPGNCLYFRTGVMADEYHDVGKLAPKNQETLHGGRDAGPLHNHCDAGAAFLHDVIGNATAACLVCAHHSGLPNLNDEIWGLYPFRKEPVDPAVLDHLIAIHEQELGTQRPDRWPDERKPDSLGFRLLLSCLVDADHEDASQVHIEKPDTRWEDRLLALDAHVNRLRLQALSDPAVDEALVGLRTRFYDECSAASPSTGIVYCDGPVGIGKTTAIMANLLKLAVKKGLRHIFVVLPYTTIISQAVKEYREALVLPGEIPEEIVAEHHHRADYASISLRRLATTWAAPIIVTTAVQFFETLAGNNPTKLRKLHELPGSAILVDESHAALPSKLLAPAWTWMQKLATEWGCHLCFSSGTMVKFWELPEFDTHTAVPVDPVLTSSLVNELEQYERTRTDLNIMESQDIPNFESASALSREVAISKGPRLVVMNTVKAAAVLAHTMRESGHDVLHLSTALTPSDRERVIDKVTLRLKNTGTDDDWTLVATSCVESGMDFSFQTGFAQSRSLHSLLQIRGRVGRKGERDTKLTCFTTSEPRFPTNPSFDVSVAEFTKLIKMDFLSEKSITEAVTLGFHNEVKATLADWQALLKKDRARAFKYVADAFRVIDDEKVTVIACQDLIDKIQQGQHISFHQLQRGSVALSDSLIRLLAPKPLGSELELLALKADQYDSFLGYMKTIVGR